MRIRPVRFTNDVAAMRRFLEALGLRARIASDQGGWVDFTIDSPGMAATSLVNRTGRTRMAQAPSFASR